MRKGGISPRMPKQRYKDCGWCGGASQPAFPPTQSPSDRQIAGREPCERNQKFQQGLPWVVFAGFTCSQGWDPVPGRCIIQALPAPEIKRGLVRGCKPRSPNYNFEHPASCILFKVSIVWDKANVSSECDKSACASGPMHCLSLHAIPSTGACALGIFQLVSVQHITEILH